MSNSFGVRLTNLGVLDISGRDSAAFLQGLTTNDVGAIGPQNAQLSSINSAQGRVEAVIMVLRQIARFRLVLQSDLVPLVAEYLRRYVLRADVVVKTPGPAVELLGLIGTHAVEAIETSVANDKETGNLANIQVTKWSETSDRWLCTGEAAVLDQVDRVSQVKDDSDSVMAWQRHDIEDGLPTIVASTRGLFLPQMINLDLLGAISFTKGCYTGQEIIARTQHLGRIKRRMFRFSTASNAMPQPGQQLYQDGRPVGTVVNSAKVSQSASEILAVLRLEAVAGQLCLAADGTGPLQRQDMAYVVEESASG